MQRETNPNLEVLEIAVRQLGPMVDEMVFLGGCASGLLLTDSAAAPVRVTRDIDVIVEVGSTAEYHRIAKRLKARGFRESQDPDAPICRWKSEDVVLDVMPTLSEILGFGNEWYVPAMRSAVNYQLPSGGVIRLVTAPYFLATKLVAFENRGHGDFLGSQDLEDLIAVIDGRPEVVDEVLDANRKLTRFLAEQFSKLLENPRFQQVVPGHLPTDPASQARLSLVLKRMSQIAKG